MRPPDYTFDASRLDVLTSYGVLDTPAEKGFDSIVELAAYICETPVALVSLVAADRQWFKARVGFESCETDLNSSVCAFALVEPDIMVITDLSIDERTRDNPLVVDTPGIRFYAGAPLVTAEGAVLGSLCVIDDKPRPQGLSKDQKTGLRNLAHQVMAQLELRRTLSQRDTAIAEQKRIDVERQKSETLYQALFHALDAGFCIIELKFDGDVARDYRFIEVNAAFAGQTGLHDAAGKWMRELAPAHEQYWFDLYGQVALSGEPVRFEQTATQLDNRWFEVHAFRVGGPALRRVGILFTDISVRKEAERIRSEIEAEQDILNKELSHRMKNTFAMVHAIATQTLRVVPDQQPVIAFTDRLSALSTAHDVLLQEDWKAADIGAVLRAAVGPLAQRDRVDMSGPPVKLSDRATLSLSLLLHELAANATKYGALSSDQGRIAIAWSIEGKGETAELVLHWHESGGPPVEQPSRKGFGSRLIKLGFGTGQADLRYNRSGFEAEFRAPLALVLST